jgi:ligand-binding sensor domain-containing protein/signal transduction histidine kinase
MRALAGSLTLLLTAAAGFATQLPLRIYTVADGLARDAANCVVIDSRSFLWVCTAEGLSRFDGNSFVNYGVAQGLPSRAVNAFLETREGVYLAATDGGIARLDPAAAAGSARKFVPLGVAGAIYSLHEDRSGTVWAAATGGLYRIRGLQAAWEAFPLPPGEIVKSLAEDAGGNLWAGTSHGLCRRTPAGAAECFGNAPGLPGDTVNAVAITRDGKLWAGSFKGLWRIAIDSPAPRAERFFGVADGLASARVHSIFQSPSGTLWVGTAQALSELNGDRFSNYSAEQGLNGRAVLAINEDSEGNLWAAVDHGLARIARHGFATFTAGEGMGGARSVTELLETGGQVYAVTNETSSIMLHRFSGGGFTSVKPLYPPSIHYFGWASNQSVLLDRAGEWWIATGEGLCRFPRVEFAQLAHTPPKAVYTTRDGLAGNDIFRLYEDARGDIWITALASAGGPSRWERATGRFHHYALSDVPGYATAYAEDHAGNLWIGVSNDANTLRPNGLVRYRDGGFERFTAADGVPPGWISALHVDRAGHLWMASSDGGVGRADDPAAPHPHITVYSTAQGLSSVTARRIGEDLAGRIYIGTARALDRFDPATGTWKRYSTADGLAGGMVSALLRDSQGAMWLGTTMGLSRMSPEPDSPRPTPPVYITALNVNGEPLAVTEPGVRAIRDLRLQPDQRQVHIEYVAIGQAVEYQYKLEGAQWSAPFTQHSVNYASLPPGLYHFAVRAVAAPGMGSPAPAEVTFRILPPVWRQWWFVSLAIAIAAVLMLGAHRYHLARRLELERVRLRIAADLHDDLGASLTRVAILSEIVNRQTGLPHAEPARYLSEIAETARSLVDGMSDIVWAIDPRSDDMRSLVRRVRQFAGEALEPLGIAWKLDTPAEMEDRAFSPDQRRNAFLIVKEAVHNAARHSRCRQVSLAIRVEQGECHVVIEDDGVGLPDANSGGDGAEPESGNGLANMRARALALHGTLAISAAAAGGTRIALQFPMARPHKYALAGGLRNGS